MECDQGTAMRSRLKLTNDRSMLFGEAESCVEYPIEEVSQRSTFKEVGLTTNHLTEIRHSLKILIWDWLLILTL